MTCNVAQDTLKRSAECFKMLALLVKKLEVDEAFMEGKQNVLNLGATRLWKNHSKDRKCAICDNCHKFGNKMKKFVECTLYRPSFIGVSATCARYS